MAGLGWRDWATGEVVTEANMQGYLQDQTVMAFASAAARDAAVTAPTEGMHAYLADADTITRYNGSAWETAAIQSVRKNSAGTSFQRKRLNLIEGTNITLTVSDDAGNDELDITIASTVSTADRAVLTGFTQAKVSGTTSNSQLRRILADGASSVENYQMPVVMDRAGSIVGVTVTASTARTAGTLTVEPYINGVGTGLTAVLNGTNTQYVASSQSSGLDTFVSGDRIDVRYTTSSWTPTSAGIEATVIVQYT